MQRLATRITVASVGFSLLALAVFTTAASAAGGAGAKGEPLPHFSHPTSITNPYLPLSSLHADILTGTEEGKPVRVERTMKPGTRLFLYDGQKIEARIMEDRETVGGQLAEVTEDYFAQDDRGAVYYMGEKVDVYRGGNVVGHEGAWLTGEHGAVPGVLMPAHPHKGSKFHSENAPGIAVEADEVVSTDETVRTPAGRFLHCLKVKETVPGEQPEYKYYAKGIGVVREVPHGGYEKLITHNK